MFGGKLDVGRREGLVELWLTVTSKFLAITLDQGFLTGSKSTPRG